LNLLIGRADRAQAGAAGARERSGERAAAGARLSMEDTGSYALDAELSPDLRS